MTSHRMSIHLTDFARARLFPREPRRNTIQDITPELAESFGLQDTHGALIAGVLRASPADRAGIRPGDVLVAVGGEAVPDPRAMLDMVAALPPGRNASFRVRRGDTELELAVEIGRRPTPPPNR